LDAGPRFGAVSVSAGSRQKSAATPVARRETLIRMNEPTKLQRVGRDYLLHLPS